MAWDGTIRRRISYISPVPLGSIITFECHHSQHSIYSARRGDLFMSLIHTCELNSANPFDYLTELQRHAEELARNPAQWMPWNYRETLMRLATPAATEYDGSTTWPERIDCGHADRG